MTLPPTKITWTVAALAALLAFGSSAGAQTVTASRCAAAKARCVMGKTHRCGVVGVRGQLKCHQNADIRSSPVDPECLKLAVDELRECFWYAEQRGDCLTTSDPAPHQAAIDAFVADVVGDLNPGYPTLITNRCLVGKLEAVGEGVFDKLDCFKEAFRLGGPVDQLCLLEAEGRFAYKFTKLENNGDCLTTGDMAALMDKIDAFVATTVAALDPGPLLNRQPATRRRR